ncbi:MAG TPA: hypothetical protein VKE74_32875 [Gemmataceae bacterium]|nr:hypothetical protein [Gemmataceae bacterium]
MSRLLIPVALFFVSLVAVARAEPAARSEPPRELVPSISDIMVEAHGCQTAYIKQVRNELAKDEPDWYLVEAKSRDLVRVGKLLALNNPPHGSRESWEKFTAVYTARATVLVDAAERKDKEEATVETTRMLRMCATCHRAHR